MSNFLEIINAQKITSPLPMLFDLGYTPDKVRDEIIATFSPYFMNISNLEENALNWLVSDWINYKEISTKYSGIDKDIAVVLGAYNKAKHINLNDTLNIIVEMLDLHLDTGNKFWSILKLEVPKSNLPLYEFVQTSMVDISNIVEGLSKSLLIEQVLIQRILRNKKAELAQVKELKLGNLIDELITNTSYPQMFYTYPEKIKLSDWRNIASHHSFEIQGQRIICSYGTGSKKNHIVLTRDQLLEKVSQCYRTLAILNMSHKIFGFDNLDTIRAKSFTPSTMPREEIGFLVFSSGITSQGYEVESYENEKDEAILTVRDLTDYDPFKRSIHSSQFLQNLWVITKKAKMVVKYKKKDGKLTLISSCSKNICEEIASGVKPFDALAEYVNFELLPTV